MIFAQTAVIPHDGEYSASGAIGGNQFHPAVAIGAGGGFAAWDDDGVDPFGTGIRGRLLDANSLPFGEPFQINTTIVGDQQRPAVSLLNDGGAFVVWESGKPGAQNVYARVVNPNGSFATGEILVNNPAISVNHNITTNWTLVRNNKPRAKTQKIREILDNREESNGNLGVATLKDGSVVVVYTSSRKYHIKSFMLSEKITLNRQSVLITNRTRVPFETSADYMQDVYMQRFSPAGEKLGSETVVHNGRSLNQRSGKVAALEGGGFIVSWINEVPGNEGVFNSSLARQGGGRKDVICQLFSATGDRVGSEIRAGTNFPCAAPVVAGRADGGFTLAWVQRDNEWNNGFDIWFRPFSSSGAALAPAARVNSRIFGDQFAPAIARMGNQELLVWSSMGQDGSWEGVYARSLQGASLTAEDEIRVNTTTYLRQIEPAVSGYGAQATVIWSGFAFDTGFDVFGQRYQLP